MIDAEKQIIYWRKGSQEDIAVARELLDKKRIRHGLFFVHLSLEKMFKAHFCRVTREVAPKQHNLLKLAERAGLSLDEETLDLLAVVNFFCLEGRYPDTLIPEPAAEEAATYLLKVEKVLEWLNRQFE
jgi:HEPN domain-containing protein